MVSIGDSVDSGMVQCLRARIIPVGRGGCKQCLQVCPANALILRMNAASQAPAPALLMKEQDCMARNVSKTLLRGEGMYLKVL